MKKTLLQYILSIAVVFIMTPTFAAAIDYYVDTTNGNDNNNGLALGAAFKTIQKCANVAQNGQTCFIRSGTYRETIYPKTGQIFTNYNGETVTVDGRDIITGWNLVAGNRWSVPTNRTLNIPNDSDPRRRKGYDQVFVDDEMMIEARWPNINHLRITRPNSGDMRVTQGGGSDSVFTGYFIDTGLQIFSTNFLSGIHATFTPGRLRVRRACEIYANNGSRIDLNCEGHATSVGGGSFTSDPYNPQTGNYYYLRGDKKLLDYPGEWVREYTGAGSFGGTTLTGKYYVSGTITLEFPSGKTPNNSVTSVKSRTWAFYLENAPNVTISGLNIIGSTIYVSKNSSGAILDGLNMKYYSHVFHPQGGQAGIFKKTAVGLQLVGDNSVLKNSYLAYSSSNGISLYDTNAGATQNVKIENNVIHDVGYADGEGIARDFNDRSIGTVINRNTLFNVASIGIRIPIGGIVSFNDVYLTHTLESDTAAIYEYTVNLSGAYINNNWVHDIYAPEDDVLHFFGPAGIYLDFEVSDVTIHHNILWNIPDPNTDKTLFGLAYCSSNNVNPSCTSNPEFLNQNKRVYHNTVVGGGIDFANNGSGTFLYNNMATRGDTQGVFTYPWNISTGYYYLNQMGGNFGFLNSNNFDFRIGNTSSAIDRGVTTGGISYNYAISGSKPDAGAFELGAPYWIAGSILREQDLQNISLNCYVTGGATTCSFSDMPIGRKIPLNLEIKIENGSYSSGVFCTNYMNYSAHYHTGSCSQIPNTLTGNRQFSMRIGSTGTVVQRTISISDTANLNMGDSVPNAFSFNAISNAALNSGYTSNAITVTGINTGTSISISNGRYRINGGAFTSANGTVIQGDSITVFLTSANAYSTLTSAVLTIGGVNGTFSVTTTGSSADSIPNSYSFATQSELDLTGSFIISEAITLTGYNTGTTIFKISGPGSFSVNGGGFTTNTGTLSPGQTLRVRLPGILTFGTTSTIVLSVGGVTGSFTAITKSADSIPDPFSFTPVTIAELNSGYISNAITVTGINTGSSISISNGRYRINGGAFTSANGTVVQGDSVAVFLTSANAYSTLTSAVLTIGGVTGSFSVTTLDAIDSTPDAFSFGSISAVQPSITLTTGPILLTGFLTGTTLSITNGNYSFDNSGFVNTSTTVQPGTQVWVRQNTALGFNSSITTTLTVGGINGSFVTTTRPRTLPTINNLSYITTPTTLSAFTGTAYPGDTVRLFINSSLYATGTANSSGTRSLSGMSLTTGFYTLSSTTRTPISDIFVGTSNVVSISIGSGALTGCIDNPEFSFLTEGATNVLCYETRRFRVFHPLNNIQLSGSNLQTGDNVRIRIRYVNFSNTTISSKTFRIFNIPFVTQESLQPQESGAAFLFMKVFKPNALSGIVE